MSIFRILYHEAMHSLLAHIPRMKSYNEGNPNTPADWEDLNIAGDLEINGMMVDDGICGSDFWKSQKGCYSTETSGLPMETIIKNYMHIVNQQKNIPQNPVEPPVVDGNDGGDEKGGKTTIHRIPTSRDWKNGRRAGRELIRKLYKHKNRSAADTLDEIDKIMKQCNGDIKKFADELSKMFPNQ